MQLTKVRKSSKTTDEQLPLLGCEQIVDRARTLFETIESLETELNECNKEITERAREVRINAEKAGVFAKSVIAHGSLAPSRVTWTNRFSAVTVENEAQLRELLGSNFDRLFDVSEWVKIREGAVTRLKQLLGAEFNALISTGPQIAAKKELMEARFAIRPQYDEGRNAEIDDTLVGIQYKPSMTHK